MRQDVVVKEINGVLVPDVSGQYIATADVQFVNGVKMATIAWAGKMMGCLTFDSNNFLVSIQILDVCDNTPSVSQSLENIGAAI